MTHFFDECDYEILKMLVTCNEYEIIENPTQRLWQWNVSFWFTCSLSSC